MSQDHSGFPLIRIIKMLVDLRGGLRPLARKTKIDVAYLFRLKSGEKTAPSEETMEKLGIVKMPDRYQFSGFGPK